MVYSVPVTVILFLIVSLSIISVSCEDGMDSSVSNCFIRDYNNIRCSGDFNVSKILFEQRQLNDPNAGFWLQTTFSGLEIFDTNIEEIDEKFIQFHGFKFETILIENAPKLKSIAPKALIELKDDLTDFRAINTGLPPYNDFANESFGKDNPFDDFKQLHEVYVGEQSRCPIDKTLVFPCKCEFGELPRAVPNGVHGWSAGISNTFGTTTQITCNVNDLTGDELKKIFENVSRSDHQPKHFDVLTIQGAMGLTNMPRNVFSNLTLTTIWMKNVDNLKSIHPEAFVSESSDRVARSIQILDISSANFTSASSSEVDDLFRAFSSLTNIRVLRLSQAGIPFIPSHAFAPENPQIRLNNLLFLSLSFDRRRHKSGIKSVGSYAFSGAPKLIELGISKNFIEEFDSFAFAFNETSQNRLTIHIGGNPFNDSFGLKPNAFSSCKRPVRMSFQVDSFAASDPANDPKLDFMPENVFRPFIEENAESYFEVDYFNVNVWCDCKSRWMFDDFGSLKPSVQRGLRINRVDDNVVGSDPLSIQCKAESSFECLSNCLTFTSAGLVHCGGSEQFDVKTTFLQLGQHLNSTEKFSKLVFSAKGIEELPRDAFGSFEFTKIDLKDCWNLTVIDPAAFGASSKSIEIFSVVNTNLTFYPNFASFPQLKVVQLDDHHTFHLNSSNFDFSGPTTISIHHPNEITVFASNNGTIDPKTFTKLGNASAVTLNIGERSDCSTLGCLIKCKPISSFLDEEIVTNFLAANPKNTIQTNCYWECSCDLKWLYEKWNVVGSRIGIWIEEYFGRSFYCVPKGAKLNNENFFGVDIPQFNYGDYFKDNNC